MSDNPRRARQLLNNVLDKGYTRITAAFNRFRAHEIQTGPLARTFGELIEEANRLRDDDKKFDRNNPLLRLFMSDMEDSLKGQARRARQLTPQLQENGIEAARRLFPELTFGMSERQLAQFASGFNLPSAQTLASAVDLVSRQAFASQLADVTPQTLSILQRIILQSVATGQDPLETARLLQQTASGYPGHYFNNLMRTLHMETYRDGQLAIEAANARLFSHKIRIAQIGNATTCMACIALHGTRMEIGERLRDHHQGLCTTQLVLRGRRVELLTGPEYFARLSPDKQREYKSFKNNQAAYEAYRQGKIQLSDFVTPYKDDLFGEMLRENSLKGILGEQAKEFYSTGQA